MSFNNSNRLNTGSMKWMKYTNDVLPMWIADMDFPTAPAIITALNKRIEHGVFGYTLPDDEIINTVVTYFAKRWHWEIKPEWLVFSPGLGVAIHTISRYLGELDKALVIPQPIYHVFRTAPPLANRDVIEVSFTNEHGKWFLDLDKLQSAILKNKSASILMLCNPHNPNGKVFTQDELTQIAQIALTNSCLICSDDVHADLVLDEDLSYTPIASLAPEIAEITLTMQSPSKAFNVAGLNFAVLVIKNEKLRKNYIDAAKGQVISQLNPLGYTAAKVAWSEQASDWLKNCIEHLRSNRDLLMSEVNALDNVHMDHLSATYLAWINIAKLNLANPHEHFLKHKLGISAGADFGDQDYIRLNFGCDTATLKEGIARFKAAVNEVN